MIEQYNGPAVYGILVNHCLVYIGATDHFDNRRCQHWEEIRKGTAENKYFLLKAANDVGLGPTFVILTKENVWENEKKWIKSVTPCLNSIHNNKKGLHLTESEFWDTVLNEDTYIPGAITYN